MKYVENTFLILIDIGLIYIFSLSALPAFGVVILWFLSMIIWYGYGRNYNYLGRISENHKHSVVLSPPNIKKIQKIFRISQLYSRLYIPLLIISIGFFFSINTGRFLTVFEVSKPFATSAAWTVFTILTILMTSKAFILHKTAYILQRNKIHKLTNTASSAK